MNFWRDFLEVQWLRLCASIAGDSGSFPDYVIKIPHALWCGQKKKKKKKKYMNFKKFQVIPLLHNLSN